MRSAHLLRAIGAATLIGTFTAPAVSAQDLSTSDLEQLGMDHYTCAVAMAYALEFGNALEISEAEALQGLDAVLATGRVNEEYITADVNEELAEEYGYVPLAELDDQPDEFLIFAWRHAETCVEMYKQIRLVTSGGKAGSADADGASGEGREVDVAFLRAHYQQNRNSRLIVDYITGRYPYGKPMMGDPVPEMEYLGEFIADASDVAMKSLSDAALLAMVNSQYWQYNPPASRKVMAEYQRRLRVQRYNEREAQLWAERVDRERRSELATMASRMAERWGTAIKCTNVAPQGVEGRSYTSCRMLDEFGQ
jgi:hypothetical protein